MLASLEQRLAEGYALSVSRELARELSLHPDQATPDELLLAARAHAQAGFWKVVDRLLSDRAWIDELESGGGRLLLARSAQEQGRHDEADEHFARFAASGALRGSPPPAETHVLWARSLAALGRHAEAARRYEDAAADAPEVAHWLRLSAMQELAELGEVDALVVLATLIGRGSAVPRDSIWLTAATAAFRAGETDRGIRFTDSLSVRAKTRLAGDWVAPALLAAGDTVSARSVLDAAMRVGGGGRTVGDLILRLDDSWSARHAVAQSDLAEGRYRRAAEGLSAALQAAPQPTQPAMVLEHARALFGQRKYADVHRLLMPWIEPTRRTGERPTVYAPTLAAMWFLSGRSLYRRGQRTAALEAFERTSEIPNSRDGAYASFLIADTWHDRGRLDDALSAYERTVTRFPRSGYAGTALIRLGLLKLAQAEPTTAREYFERYRQRFPRGNWYQAATYWSAAAVDQAGQASEAHVLYRETIGYDPITFYAMRAGERIGVDTWEEILRHPEPQMPDLAARHDRLLEQMDLLRSMGWTARAKLEFRQQRRSVRGLGQSLALATALNQAGWTREGSAIGWTLYGNQAGKWNRALLRTVFPLNYADPLMEASSREGLDPALVAALIRRESIFDPNVVSSANAIGLMQIIPATGTELARRIGLTEFTSAQLTVPEINLALGTRYLRDLLRRFQGQPVAALVSYNAGPHRYLRWREFPEFKAGGDIEIDRIPFAETRRYVKAVLSYRFLYRRLYGLEPDQDDGSSGP
ncbi:MAG: transglycosylase SLT domain-containing protein [Gemmatimonadota bacterium]